MNKQLVDQPENSILQATNYLPSISIIMPFDIDISIKTEISHKLQLALEEIKKELIKNYPKERYEPVMKKLEDLTSDIKWETHKKSIAIFASPLAGKIFFLDIPAEEKIIIDESFEIRDLVYSKKNINTYLLGILSAQSIRFFLGNGQQFIRIKTGIPEHIAAYKNDIPQKVSNFSDPSHRKEVLLEKILQHADKELEELLKKHPFPVFILGAERVTGHFKKLSHNTNHIISYIHGNYETATEAELFKVLQPYIDDWQKNKQAIIYDQLNLAMNSKKLVTGIHNVWKASLGKKGRLLFVEQDYIFPARISPNKKDIYAAGKAHGSNIYLKDAVDDIIAAIIHNGGEVEFTQKDSLQDYGHIALIEYY